MSDSVQPHRRQPTRLPVPGILQARTLEWVAISFANAWKWKVKVKSLSCVRLFATPYTAANQAPPSLRFSRQEYRSGVPLPSPSLGITIYEIWDTFRWYVTDTADPILANLFFCLFWMAALSFREWKLEMELKLKSGFQNFTLLKIRDNPMEWTHSKLKLIWKWIWKRLTCYLSKRNSLMVRR